MKQTNTYIFLYASGMVLVVAAILSVASMVLKPYQERNVEIAKKLDILSSVGKAADLGSAPNKNVYVEQEYDKYIRESYVINSTGERIEGLDAFSVKLNEEVRKPVELRNLPVYVAQHEDNTVNYIIPVLGRGLWGPIRGYVALNDDFNTIFGVIFDHDKETPGLGAEINTSAFEDQFKGKQIFNENGEFISIRVQKAGLPPFGNSSVDGISGGTITSQGVDLMLKDVLGSYETYFKSQMKLSYE
jgi:Na+-transporting NADH:ubiquinone oxidoreductase subunit C